jgi:phenylpropionate dioxygenase-like ring-hydroxylating dioxygenase large terminal subunit
VIANALGHLRNLALLVADVRQAEQKAAKICLKTYPTRDYLGMIFAFLGEGETPEFHALPRTADFTFDEEEVAAFV